MKATETMEIVNEGMFQLEHLYKKIQILSGGVKVFVGRQGGRLHALIQAHKETAMEVASLINN